MEMYKATLMSKRYNHLLDAIGVFLLLLIAIIEYYNRIILSSGYSFDFIMQEDLGLIFSFIRRSLWQVHLITGFSIALVLLIKSYLDSSVYSAIIGFGTFITGMSNFVTLNELLRALHLVFVIISIFILLQGFIKNYVKQ